MLHFLQSNIASVLTLLVVALLVILAIYSVVKNKKAGKSSCGYSCQGCPNAEFCHNRTPDNSEQ